MGTNNFLKSPIRMRKILILSLTILLVVGCKSIGPGRVQMDRGAYNNIIRETDQEQLLTNIVRQRYLEITQYIQVTSLTASYSLSPSLSGSVSASTHPGPTALSSSLSPTVSYSDTPTISYIPLSNKEFAVSLMTPITMNNFLILAHAGGYDQIVLYSIFFEQIGDYNDNLLHYDGTNHLTTGFNKYDKVIHLLSKLYRNDSFEPPVPVIYGKQLGGMLRFKTHQENSHDAIELKKLLGISSNSKEIILMEHSLLEPLEEKDGILISPEMVSKPHNVVYVTFRSVYAVIYLLGYGVQVPYKDINDHLTRELIKADGSRYEWKYRMRNILTVYSSDHVPNEPTLVQVRVHNHWFYIKASDQVSKGTFDAVIRMLTLTSAVAASSNGLPVLTIPVAAAAH